MRTGRPELDATIRAVGIPAEEPTFILRGKDALAVETIHHYAQLALARGCSVALVESALLQADEIANWPIKRLPDIELPDAQRLQLEYQHGRRTMVRDGALEVSAAYEQGVAAGVARARRGSREVELEAALRGLSAKRPFNWDDGEDPELEAAWRVVDAVLGEASA